MYIYIYIYYTYTYPDGLRPPATGAWADCQQTNNQQNNQTATKIAPSWAQEPIKTPRGEEMDLQGPPWDLQPKMRPSRGQVGYKLAILWTCALIFVSKCST